MYCCRDGEKRETGHVNRKHQREKRREIPEGSPLSLCPGFSLGWALFLDLNLEHTVILDNRLDFENAARDS